MEINLNDVADRILSLDRKSHSDLAEIGKLLKSVKESDLLEGEFQKWLKDKVNLDCSTSSKIIRIYEQFSNQPYFTELSSTRLYELVQFPDTYNRDTLISTKFVIPSTGEEKTVREMTRKELREVKLKVNREYKETKVKTMPNDYEIRGEYTVIFLKRRDGTIYETKIDTEDLPKVKSFPNSWVAHLSSGYVYANAGIRVDGKQKTIKLHRFILDAPDGFDVDHINHDTLDNRKSNLRVVTRAQNSQNRKGSRSDKKTEGGRNISWDETRKRWEVNVTSGGKRVYIGMYKNLEDAEAAALSARIQYLPYSKEAFDFENGLL
ncbi:HNH endonuclease [Aneurinibacillus aneurinilyticus]|jgi:hypothetical protein|uniref:DUF3102 domain-containing protein n=1 Tax=Aneurinibacillus aneurinilyticus TaxID=1391 RepID=A0A848CWC4_ANEAE|nr:HNH endonuclease [Aneurinibacillus aneurinilyticus]NMF00054.1 DUF3102 domain-containing protein [Aneurinibacillus aneurinilyticus]